MKTSTPSTQRHAEQENLWKDGATAGSFVHLILEFGAGGAGPVTAATRTAL